MTKPRRRIHSTGDAILSEIADLLIEVRDLLQDHQPSDADLASQSAEPKPVPAASPPTVSTDDDAKEHKAWPQADMTEAMHVTEPAPPLRPVKKTTAKKADPSRRRP